MKKILPKCQICDGPIVNGRCKLCGMPYRNDEARYHLNETRRDHEKHDAEGAKKNGKQAKMPLYGQSVPKPQAKKTSDKKQKGVISSGSKVPRGYRDTFTEKKKSGFRWVVLLVCLLIVLGLPKGVGSLQEKLRTFVDGFGQSDLEEMKLAYILKGTSGETTVGDFLEPGSYVINVRNGYATLWVETEESLARYHLSEEEPQTKIKTKEGDVLSVHNSSSQDTFVEFYTKE